MGLCGFFCEWTNEIKAWKFVPQHQVYLIEKKKGLVKEKKMLYKGKKG